MQARPASEVTCGHSSVLQAFDTGSVSKPFQEDKKRIWRIVVVFPFFRPPSRTRTQPHTQRCNIYIYYLHMHMYVTPPVRHGLCVHIYICIYIYICHCIILNMLDASPTAELCNWPSICFCRRSISVRKHLSNELEFIYQRHAGSLERSGTIELGQWPSLGLLNSGVLAARSFVWGD